MPTTTSPGRRVRRRRALVLTSLVAVVAATTAVDAQPAAAVPLPVNIEGFQDGLYVPIDDVVLGESGDASVVANGNLAVTWAGTDLRPTLEDDALTEFDSDLGLRGALTLELAAETSGDLDGILEVLSVPVGEFPAGPVTVIPYLGIDVQFSGHAEAGAQLSLVAPFNVSAAIAKLGGRPTATAEQRPSFRPEIGLPDAANALAFNAEVELNISVTFMMLLNGVPIGGPALIAALGAALDVDLTADPWWSLDGTAGLKYAWATPDPAGLPRLPRRPPSLFPAAHFPIAHAPDDGPVADVSTRWSRAFDIFNSDVAGAVLPIGDRLVVVEDAANPWMATLDGNGNPDLAAHELAVVREPGRRPHRHRQPGDRRGQRQRPVAHRQFRPRVRLAGLVQASRRRRRHLRGLVSCHADDRRGDRRRQRPARDRRGGTADPRRGRR